MPKKNSEKKRAIGIPEETYLEIERFASKQNPVLFLYEVLVKACEEFKMKHKN